MFHTPAHKQLPKTLGDAIKEEQQKMEKETKTLGQLLEDNYDAVYKNRTGFPTGSSEHVAHVLFWQTIAERFLKEVAKRNVC